MKTRLNGRLWRHPGSRSLVLLGLALLLLLVAAPLAPASSASPAAAPSSLHIGWVQEPDNLNPFIGIQGTDYMLWHMNYDFLVGFDAKTLEPRPELATKWEVSPDGKEWTFTIRDDATWQDGEPVTASDVAFTFNYINENQLLNLAAYTDGITKAEVDRRDARQDHDRQAQGQHATHGRPDPAGAHLEQGERQGGGVLVPEQAADRRLRPLPDRGVAEGQVRPPAGQPRLLGRQAQGGRGHLPALHQPRHDGAGPQARHHRRRHQRAGRPVHATRRRAGPHDQQRHVLAVHRDRHELLRLARLPRQPGPAGPAVPPGDQLGGGPREGRLHRHERLRDRRLQPHRPVLQVPLGARRPTSCSPTTRRRPTSCSTRPATRTSTATASARPRTARS